MLSKLLKVIREEKGSSLLLFSFVFMVILAMTGLVVDGGILYKTRSSLKKTANAAALSGAQLLLQNETEATTAVNNILSADGETSSLQEVLYKPNGENKVTVSLKRDVPTTFMKLFNIKSVSVSAKSSAAIAPISRADGAVPLGINKDTELVYGEEYTLKVDAGDSEIGNFGVLALSGTGANLYEKDLTYGFEDEIKVGDIIGTQTGNVAGKTRDGVNFRISSSPYADGDTSHSDDPRILIILVYEPYEITTNQLKSVKITGFAYFYLEKPMGHNDSSITGKFIQLIGTETVGGGSVTNYGAYGLRLVE